MLKGVLLRNLVVHLGLIPTHFSSFRAITIKNAMKDCNAFIEPQVRSLISQIIKYLRNTLSQQTLIFRLSVVTCILISNSEIQTRFRGSTKEGLVTFVKNHASSFTKIKSQLIVNVKGRFLSFKKY